MCYDQSRPDSAHRHETLDTDWRLRRQQSSLKILTNLKSTQYFICQTGGKIFVICESLLRLIDPCSGPLSRAGCGEKFAEIAMSVCLLLLIFNCRQERRF